MRIKLKTLKQNVYDLELNSENCTILEVKQAIELSYGFETKSIKLIYNGIIVDDKESINFYNIKEGATLILMTSKIQKKEEKKEEIINNNLSNTDNKDLQNNKESQKQQEKVVVPVIKPKDSGFKYQEQLKQLTEMGFSESTCRDAITAANGSVPIAIEYLYSGIPPNLGGMQEGNLLYGNENEDNGQEDGEDIDDLYSEEAKENLDAPLHINTEMFDGINLQDPNALKNIASVIKVIVKEDPSLLQELLAEVEEYNPQIINFIREKGDEFKELMSTPPTEDDYKMYQQILGGGSSQFQLVNNNHGHDHDVIMGGDDYEDEEGEDDDGPLEEIMKDFNDKDRECINNLVSLGFAKGDAVQAYIACDKNEIAAANFLFQDKNQ
jgi:UV excision repair protein RAD23